MRLGGARRAGARTVAALAVAGAGVLAAAGCGELQVVEFTRATTTSEILDEVPPAPGETTTTTLRPARYLVQRGDSLSSIAAQFGVAVDALMAANGITDPNRLEAGVELVIPSPDDLHLPPWQQGGGFSGLSEEELEQQG